MHFSGFSFRTSSMLLLRSRKLTSIWPIYCAYRTLQYLSAYRKGSTIVTLVPTFDTSLTTPSTFASKALNGQLMTNLIANWSNGTGTSGTCKVDGLTYFSNCGDFKSITVSTGTFGELP